MNLEFPRFPIIIYICPTPGCGNFVGSPSFREDRTDITSLQTKRDLKGSVPSHARIDCPNCRMEGKGVVKRVPYVVTVMMPLQEALEHAKTSSDYNQDIQIRSEPSPTESRWEVQKPARPLISGRSSMRRIDQLRGWASKARDGIRLRRHERDMEESN